MPATLKPSRENPYVTSRGWSLELNKHLLSLVKNHTTVFKEKRTGKERAKVSWKMLLAEALSEVDEQGCPVWPVLHGANVNSNMLRQHVTRRFGYNWWRDFEFLGRQTKWVEE